MFMQAQYTKWKESEEGQRFDQRSGKDDDNIYGKLMPENHRDWE